MELIKRTHKVFEAQWTKTAFMTYALNNLRMLEIRSALSLSLADSLDTEKCIDEQRPKGRIQDDLNRGFKISFGFSI